MAKRFILVGDHYQLPPLVQNKDAQEGGLDVSLFKLLSDKQPESVVNLEHQYRMCADVMLLSNTLIYNGRLKCGNQAVADRSLNVPSILALQRFHESSRSSMFSCTSSSSKSLCPSPNTSSCWLQHTVLPPNKVVFLNTDPLLPSSLEAVANSRMTSPVEATLTLHAVEAFLAAGIDAADIGVITFYRSQLALLRQSLRHRPGLELHTADKFQGRDKEVILVSCVRSNEACIVGELLKDWRRVNVAVTRARSKLVILGSKRTLVGSGNETLKGLVDVCESKGWVLDLPANAARDHSIDDSGLSQTQADTDAGCPGVERKMRDCKLRSPKRSPMKQYLAPKGANAGAASQSPTKKSKKPLSSQSNQGVKRTTRVPEKRGVVSKKALLSGRAVLRDIVNDAMGDAGWE
ncbi:AAA domain-containing protein, partial [Phyllosticta capitalensis]|uniref:AAA domain-containing protein n=1 Tax=Phyllosticta capitalensis TaxID=121624 RepID=UPI00312CFFD9